MKFKDILEQTGPRRYTPPPGNPTQIGGKQVNPIKDTDKPGNPHKGVSAYDQERELQKQQNLKGAGQKPKLPTSDVVSRPGASAEPGLSPRERGLNPKNTPTSPAMQKVNQALQGVNINALKPEQKASLIAKINRTLKKAGPKLPRRLAGLAALASAGLELIDPSIAQAAQDAKESFMGESMQINEAPYQVIDLDGNILTAVPQGGEQAIKMDITGWVLEFGQMGPVLRQPKSPVEKDRSLPAGSQVDVQGNPRIIGTPERG
jgi:hypothetical protein